MRERPPIFVDTVYLIAAFNDRDDWADAVALLRGEFDSRRLVTTDGVVSEFLAHFSRGGASTRSRAIEHINDLKASPRVEVVELTGELVNAGTAAYAGEFLYTSLSLQDCISILVMRQRGISEALTADREFTLAGISVLMQAPVTRR